MKKLVTLLFVVIFVQMSFGQLSGIYSIGTNTISGETGNFPTFHDATIALNSGGVSGPCTFYFTDNATYTDTAVAIGCTGTSSTNTITFKPYTGITATISFTSTNLKSIDGMFVIGSPNNNSANLVSTNYITIDGSNIVDGTSRNLIIQGPVTGSAISVFRIFGNNDNITIKNCIIKNQSTSGSAAAPINSTTYTTLAADNLTIENDSLINGTANGNVGLQLSVSGTPSVYATGMVIRNNYINAVQRGIFFNYVANADVYGNTISMKNGATSAAAGAIVLMTAGPAASIFNIYNNKITKLETPNTTVGASNGMIGIDNQLASPKVVNIYNNMLSGFAFTSASVSNVKLYGIRHTGSSTSNVYYNTIYMPELTNMTAFGTSFIAGIVFASTGEVSPGASAVMIAKNNIIYSNETTMKTYGIRRGGTTGTFTSNDNNIYYTSSNVSGYIGSYNALDQATLTNWQSASSQDANSKNVSVSFTSATDLHLAGQSIGDYTLACNPIDGYTTDIDGNTRSTSKPYMGADENTNITLAAAYKRTVDADATDWTGTASGTLHASLVSNEEAIYTGEAGDARTDQHGGDANGDWNNDITEFRYTRDGSYLYFMAKLRDIADVNRPYIAIGIDANQSDDTPAWIGDDSPVSLSPATNRSWERQLTIHAVSSGVVDIEMFADDGSSWYAPLSNYQVLGSATNDVIEGRISLFDLGITTTSTLKLAIATFNNVVGYNNVVDATTASYIDVVTPGYAGSNNAWFRAGSSDNLGTDVSWSQALSALPVELTSFSSTIHGKVVNLTWKTATEVNSYGFEVERTSPRPSPYQGEGGEAGRGWEKVGYVQASGNSNSPREYMFTDNNLQEGKYQYRLKMIDNDGTFEYSNIVEAEIIAPKEFVLSQNYPNPFNPITTINYAIPMDSKVMLVVYNINGEKVAELVNEAQTAGSYNIPFSATGLASGTYIYRLQAGEFMQTKKMILLK